MAMWYLVLVAACALYVTGAQGSTIDPADADLTAPQLIAKYNYPVEVHHVTTSDGYILELHRIPHGLDGDSGTVRQPVLIMHGLLSSSVDWVIAGPKQGPAYGMADAGYDVWLGNFRGNFYSRNHTTRNPNSASFWGFSWEENGLYDLPAMIDYILQETGKLRTDSRLHYVGHSQGSTAYFVMASMLPAYNAKVYEAQMLAPVAFLNNVDDPSLQSLASMASLIGGLAQLLGINEILPRGAAILVDGTEATCNPSYSPAIMCETLIGFLISQVSEGQTGDMSVLFGQMPAGADVNQIVHFGDVMASGRFARRDLGFIGNLVRYGTSTPPNYNLNNIVTRMSFHYSDADILAVEPDVLTSAAAMRNAPVEFYAYEGITHFDFAWNPKDVFIRVVESMSKHNTS